MPSPTEHLEALAQADPAAAARVLKSVSRKLWVPHTGGQRDVLADEARFVLLRAGRRWGKTQLAAHKLIREATGNPGSMNWWVSQSDKTVRRGYRAVLKQLPRELLATEPPSENANDRILRLKNGSQIEFYTAGTPDALAGEGVDFVVVDEAALIEERVWFQLIRPTLSDTGGRALIISTPRGRNWFWQLCRRGEKGGLYSSHHFKSTDSPYVDEDEVEDARQTLPDLIYRQEYLAEFVANAASMFSVTDDVIDTLHPPEGHVVVGVDLAKKADFTVIAGINATNRRVCVYERLNDTSWPIQEERILEVSHALEEDPHVEAVTVAIDSTGIGDVVFDHLDEAGMDVVPVNFGSGLQKERMVRLLAAELDHKRAFILPEMVEEFEHYEYEISETTGRYKFEASAGHDDQVSAMLLAHWALVHEAPPDVNVWDVELDEEEVGLTGPERLVRQMSRPGPEPDTVAAIAARPEAWSSYR